MEKDDLVKEVYARFGLAYYYGECLHKQLCIIFTLASYQDKSILTKPRVEEKFQHALSLTLGNLKNGVLHLVPPKFHKDLEDAVEKRNFLAHNFWFERAHLFLNEEGMHQMIEELERHAEIYNKLDVELTEEFKAKFSNLGLTEEVYNQSLAFILDGGIPEPLTNKRKLKKREKVVAIWDMVTQENKTALIFETEDGELWQLCEVGLGWTEHSIIKSDWKKNGYINKYLPVEINPRPLTEKPWNYTFDLSKSVSLVISRGSPDQAIKYKVKTKE